MNLSRRRGTTRNELHDVGILAQPTVPGNLEEIGTFPGVGDKDSAEEVARMGGNVFGECERSVDDVLVQEVDVVALGVRRIIIEGKIACQHRVLSSCQLQSCLYHQSSCTHQDNTATPHVNLSTGVKRVTNNELGCSVARTAATRLHQITLPCAVGLDPIKPQLFDEFTITKVQFLLFGKLFFGVEGVCEAEVGNDNVAVTVQK